MAKIVGVLGSISTQGARSHTLRLRVLMLQLKILSAGTKRDFMG